MSYPASQSRQFYLGIGGNQSGPFGEQDVLNRIRQGAIPEDALVWFEGLPDWQPIGTIEYFREAFAEVQAGMLGAGEDAATPFTPPPPPSQPVESINYPAQAGAPIGAGELPDPDPAALMTSSSPMEPVFQAGGFGGAEGGFGSLKKVIAVLAITGVFVGVGAYFYSEFEGQEMGLGNQPPAFQEPKLPPRKDPQEVRQGKLRTAVSELLLKPSESLRTLNALIDESATDEVGQEAVKAAVDYYQQQSRPTEAGRILMRAGKPLEASQYFLSEPPSYQEAEEAIFQAYQQSQGPNKQDLLIQNIRLNLGKAASPERAVERIRLLEKEFPGTPHPFQYYLKSPDQQIAELFEKVSFFFVQKLLLYVDSEFPNLNLVSRPVVAVEKVGKSYRIVGSYEGEVELSQDKLPKVRFRFWLKGLDWNVVETNLTSERRRWANQRRGELEKEALASASEMRDLLELVFKQQFPRKNLHESVTEEDLVSKNPVE